MTRLQKKCFLLSAAMHVLLVVILLAGSAFRDKPPTSNIPILTMIPANILDAPGAGGGGPEPAVAPQPPQPLPVAPVVQPRPPVVQQQAPAPVERPQPRETVAEPAPPVLPPKKVTPKPSHEIHPEYDAPTALTPRKTKAKTTASATEDTSSHADNSRLKRELDRFAEAAATGVRRSGAKGTVVDMPGQGGGEAFAGYETVIYNVYFHAWTTPDGIANKLAGTDVKIVVARDGTILSADVINKSGESALDRSVERVLRAVTRLPPFPASAKDEQRTFLIRFNLEAKEGSG